MYMKEKDDCTYKAVLREAGYSADRRCLFPCVPGEWPGEQQSDVLPQEINIWYHEGPGYEVDEWAGERSS